jgi:hypothetical protein
MAYAPSAVFPRSLAIPKIAPRAKRSLLLRVFDAIEASNMRRAEREIARYLRATGGKITDEVEREIERRFLAR